MVLTCLNCGYLMDKAWIIKKGRKQKVKDSQKEETRFNSGFEGMVFIHPNQPDEFRKF